MNENDVRRAQPRVDAQEVTGFLKRLQFALAMRDLYPMAGKRAALPAIARELFVSQPCRRWRYVSLSSGVSFVVPADWPRWVVRATAKPQLLLGREAAGLVISLASIRWALRQRTVSPAFACKHLSGLLDYVVRHPEVVPILDASLTWEAAVEKRYGRIEEMADVGLLAVGGDAVAALRARLALPDGMGCEQYVKQE